MKKFCSLLVCVVLLVACPSSSSAIDSDPFKDAFSVEYKPMTDTEVSEKLNAVPLAPEGGGVLSQLSGKTYEIKDGQGFELSLAFDAQGAGVSLSAQLPPPSFPPGLLTTQESFVSEYAGLAYGDFVLVGFRKPGTARAWSVVWNLKSGLAAAYEVFFADTPSFWGLPTPSREAQRNVYLGKVDGIGASTLLPTATNRLTGKAVLWKNDLGSFYTNYGTRSWSAFYPLGQPEGFTGSWTVPSDYFDFHDARHFLYSRTESYYSGATLVELLDMNLVSQIGLKIGFDATDTLEFKLYSGNGKILGSYAAYGGFAADEYPPGAFGRFAYRPDSDKLTKEEVIDAMENEGSWTGAFEGPGKAEKMYPLSDKLSGKSFSLTFDDGLVLEYQFTDTNELKFREIGAPNWKTGRYEAFEVDANLIFFTHAIDDNFPDKIYLNVVDFDNGLATCMNSEILVNAKNPRMCIPTFHFGVVNMDGITPVSQRHGFSNGLLGTSFTWTYNDSMVSQHYYATPDSLYYSILQDGEPILMWSCDAWYVKFRENVYLMSWLESFGSGQNDSKVFNLNTMHDAGVCYGIPDGAPFEYNTYGSEARHAGTVDVSSIYGPYAVTYELNGGTGTPVTDSTPYSPGTSAGTSVTVNDIGDVTRSGYTFTGWNTVKNGSGTAYQTGDKFDIAENTALYAQWDKTYAVTYDLNDGTGTPVTDSTLYVSGASVTVKGIGDATRSGYAFAGWNTANNGSGTAYQPEASFAVTGNTTLYAQWTWVTTGAGSGGGPSSGSGTNPNPPAPGSSSSAPSSPSSPAPSSPSSSSTPSSSPTGGQPAVTGPLSGFSDSSVISPWAQSFFERLVQDGVISGYSDGTLNPKGNVTRAEFTKMIVSALKMPSGSTAKSFPADVNASDWHKQYVDIASSNSIVNGVNETSFAPNANISRQDLAAIVYRAMVFMNAELPAPTADKFSDDAQIADYAKDAVNILKSLNIVGGRDNGAFDPKAFATREETAKIICGLVDHLSKGAAVASAAAESTSPESAAVESSSPESAEAESASPDSATTEGAITA